MWLIVDPFTWSKRERILTAAELAGTTFPSLVIIHPAGIPTVDGVYVEAGAVTIVVPVSATHGHPVRVAVSPFVFPPRPAGIEGEADVAAGTYLEEQVSDTS